MMSVAVPVHASEQADCHNSESQGENRDVDQVQSSETTEPNHQLHRLQQQLREKKK